MKRGLISTFLGEDREVSSHDGWFLLQYVFLFPEDAQFQNDVRSGLDTIFQAIWVSASHEHGR